MILESGKMYYDPKGGEVELLTEQRYPAHLRAPMPGALVGDKQAGEILYRLDDHGHIYCYNGNVLGWQPLPDWHQYIDTKVKYTKLTIKNCSGNRRPKRGKGVGAD